MKKILSTILFISIAFFANAYDFMVDGLCYNFNSDGTSVTVTYQNTSSPRYSNLSGVLIIPSSVTDGVKIYSVTSIGNYAFSGCSGLTSVTIPNSVTSIGMEAFKDCTGLTSVNINDLTAWCNIGFGSGRSNPLFYAHNLYLNENKVTDLVIPNTVTTIRYYAFFGCTSLTSVTIPNSVTSIGNSAFSQCSGLTEVTIGNSVTSIGGDAFNSCSGLITLTIGNSVTSIGSYAFYGCISLSSLIWNAKTCNDFDINIYWGEYHPFYNTNIKTITFGNEVEKIPAYLCYNLTHLKTAILGENITNIGSGAFMNCSLLDNLVALRERPIFISSNVFEGVPQASCDLHVRQGSKIRYENQDVWNDFLIILEDAEDWVDVGGGSTTTLKGDVNGDGHVNSADVTAIYDILLGNE